jgi:hypothetical protein
LLPISFLDTVFPLITPPHHYPITTKPNPAGVITEGSQAFVTPTSAFSAFGAESVSAAAAPDATNDTSNVTFAISKGTVLRAVLPDGSPAPKPAPAPAPSMGVMAAAASLGEPPLEGGDRFVLPPYEGPLSPVLANPNATRARRPTAAGTVGVAAAGAITAQGYLPNVIKGEDLFKGFKGLDGQTEGAFPLDAAVAASTSLLLNAVSGKAAFYTLDANGNATGTPLKVTSLSGLFASVVSHTAPPAGYTPVFAWPSAIHDKLSGRFILACGSAVQALSAGNTWGYPSTGTPAGAFYVAVSATATPQTSAWTVWGMQLPACAAGEYSLPESVQVSGSRCRVTVTARADCFRVTHPPTHPVPPS